VITYTQAFHPGILQTMNVWVRRPGYEATTSTYMELLDNVGLPLSLLYSGPARDSREEKRGKESSS